MESERLFSWNGGNNFSPELSYKHPAVIIEEWIEHQKLVQAYEKEQKKNKALQEAYDKLIEENKMLKSVDNKDAGYCSFRDR